MSDERDDRILDAALGGRAGGLPSEDAREAARLRAAFMALAAGADPTAPPPEAKRNLFTRIEAERRRRSMKRWALAASVLLLAGAGLFPLLRGPVATVTAVAGQVLWNERPLALGDRVPAGAVLTALPGGQADLLIKDRAAFRLSNGARLVLSRLRGAMELGLNGGDLVSKVRPGNRFAVVTPLSVASVRGTVFFVRAESPVRTYVCLCQGKLHVDAGGAEVDLATDHHAAVLADGGVLREAGMEGHTDEDVATLPAP